MSAFSALRSATRAGPARLVSGMRVSLASSIAGRAYRIGALNVARTAGTRAFSVTAGRFGSGTSEFSFSRVFTTFEYESGLLTDGSFPVADISLSQKLQEELKYEQEAVVEAAAASESTPEFLKAFLEQGVWSVSDANIVTRPGF